MVRILTCTCTDFLLRSNTGEEGCGAAPRLTDLDLAGSLHSRLRDMQKSTSDPCLDSTHGEFKSGRTKVSPSRRGVDGNNPCRQAVGTNKSRPTLSPGMPSYWHLFGETSRVPTVCSCLRVVQGLVWGGWVENTGVLHALSIRPACLPCIYYGILMNLRRGRPGFFFGPGRGQPPALVSMMAGWSQ